MAINFGVSIAEMELEMHRAKKLILLLMFLSFVVGCTYSPTLSGTDIPLKMAQQHCVDLTSELPTDFLSGGTVLLGDFSQLAGIGQIMTLTSEANQPKYLANVPTFSGGATSPNGKLFAYETVIENDSSKLVVLDVNRDVVFTLPWNKEWGTFNWINNQQIEFPYFWDGYWQNASPISDIIDVVTSQRENISPKLPDAWTPGGPLVPMLVVWKAVYDPKLSVVGYMRGNEPAQTFVLWDLKNNRELWELDKWSTRTVRPVWTLDGKELAVVVLNQKEDNWDRFELYLVDRNGYAEKWIDLRGYFKDAALTLNWSPNGRYLAIVPNADQPVLILDTVRQKLLNFCVPSNVGYSSVIWSPDSSQIILPRLSDSDDPSIVLDIENERAAYITNNPNLIPIGWLADSP